VLLLLTAGDEKKTIDWDPEVVQQARRCGWGMDANACTAPQYFIDRAQR
jgi:hypothetical protein